MCEVGNHNLNILIVKNLQFTLWNWVGLQILGQRLESGHSRVLCEARKRFPALCQPKSLVPTPKLFPLDSICRIAKSSRIACHSAICFSRWIKVSFYDYYGKSFNASLFERKNLDFCMTLADFASRVLEWTIKFVVLLIFAVAKSLQEWLNVEGAKKCEEEN